MPFSRTGRPGRNFKVVGLRELIRPFRVTWPNLRAESVLELPAHTIFKSRTEVGDQLVVERYEAKKVAEGSVAEVAEFTPSPAQEQQVWTAGAQRVMIQ